MIRRGGVVSYRSSAEAQTWKTGILESVIVLLTSILKPKETETSLREVYFSRNRSRDFFFAVQNCKT